ncbi:hypothetical protein VNI00_009392 [Paramarasmius palmivorus]|uniref:Uncharacterized protein n=1 Tax=Paramarasmius palmivorus TaxID=297713 RepID=A0AAW0CP54_9AGAR
MFVLAHQSPGPVEALSPAIPHRRGPQLSQALRRIAQPALAEYLLPREPLALCLQLQLHAFAVSSDSALDNVAPPSIVIPVNSVYQLPSSSSNDNVNNAATPSVDQVTVQNINGADANPTNSIVVPSSTFESVPGTLTASPSTATSASTSVISPTSIGIPVPPLSPSGSLKKGPKIALIIGLIIAFLILLFVLIVWLCRRKRQRETRQFMRRIHPFAEKYWLYPNVAQEKQLGHQAGDAASTLVGSDHGEGDVEKSPVAHVPPPIQVPIYRPETRSTSGSVSTVLPEYHALMTPMPPVYSRMSVDPFRV